MKKLVLALAIATAGAVYAKTTPVMGSLFTPVQAPDAEYDVKGLRLSLVYGECQTFTGLDLGIANRSRKSFSGLGIGGGNIVDGTLYGGQLGLVNWNYQAGSGKDGRSLGAQLGLVNYATGFCGLQDGVVSVARNKVLGVQWSLVNYTKDLDGLQCGYCFLFAANFVEGRMNGCQIGLFNYAAVVESGIQIGLVNMIGKGGFAHVMPIINGKF